MLTAASLGTRPKKKTKRRRRRCKKCERMSAQIIIIIIFLSRSSFSTSIISMLRIIRTKRIAKNKCLTSKIWNRALLRIWGRRIFRITILVRPLIFCDHSLCLLPLHFLLHVIVFAFVVVQISAYCAKYLFNGSRLFDTKLTLYGAVSVFIRTNEIQCVVQRSQQQRQRQQSAKQESKWKTECSANESNKENEKKKKNAKSVTPGRETKWTRESEELFSLKLFPLYLLWFLFRFYCGCTAHWEPDPNAVKGIISTVGTDNDGRIVSSRHCTQFRFE